MSELGSPIGSVVESTPAQIRIEINDLKVFETNKSKLTIGQYLLVASGNNQYLVATIMAVRATYSETSDDSSQARFGIDLQPVGTWSTDTAFERGAQSLPVPTEPAFVAPAAVIAAIFSSSTRVSFSFGVLSVAPNVAVEIDGDRFFGKHVAIVGSTGSGKSCAVASILQNVIGFEAQKNVYKEAQRNAHIIILDVHAEYASAFRLHADEKFTLSELDVDNLMLPYWLMNAEELEEMFIESSEMNSHNQISQFRHAVVRNKRKHNPELPDVSFDLPVYFSIEEVVNYLENMNIEVVGKLGGEGKPKLEDGTLIIDRDEYYFDQIRTFVTASTSKDTKASNGPFHGEFDRLILRLRTKLADPRLGFLLDPKKPNNQVLQTSDFGVVVQQFTGYLSKANVSIVDLSGVPFEVLSIVVSLVSRIIFDFGFHYTKIKHLRGEVSDVPIMLVCEEAHNYVPRSGGAVYNASRKSIERIAKEGRKYGVTLMVVSQRPSEVSETIVSQCNNFIALRLTNSADQNYIKSLLPDMTSGLGDLLPNLALGEFLAVGDAIVMPTVGRFKCPEPEPHSRSVSYLQEWRSHWRDVSFEGVINRWRGGMRRPSGSGVVIADVDPPETGA